MRALLTIVLMTVGLAAQTAPAYLNQGVAHFKSGEYAAAAIQEFQTVLEGDARNLLATQSLASLYYNIKDFRKSEEWNHQVLAIDPNNVSAYYTLGVIPWTEFIPADREARAHEQMRPEDPPPLNDSDERALLRAKYWTSLTDGIEYERKALAIDPDYDNAMAYLNLLIRYRADLDESKEQAQADIREADEWVRKALSAQKAKAASLPAK